MTTAPDRCCFIPPRLNKLLTKSNKTRGKYMIGAQFHRRFRKFTSQLNDGYGNLVHLGYFVTEIDAHNAYRRAKQEMIANLAEKYAKTGEITEAVYAALVAYRVDAND